MTYEPIIRYAPIIVPIILAAGIVAVRVYRPPQLPSAPAVADAAARSCGDAERERSRLRPSRPLSNDHAHDKKRCRVSAPLLFERRRLREATGEEQMPGLSPRLSTHSDYDRPVRPI